MSEKDRFITYKCSNCGGTYRSLCITDRCPWCGEPYGNGLEKMVGVFEKLFKAFSSFLAILFWILIIYIIASFFVFHHLSYIAIGILIIDIIAVVIIDYFF